MNSTNDVYSTGLQRYLGLDPDAWKQLLEYFNEFQCTVPSASIILNEVATLRGQLAFVESRLRQIQEVLK